VDILYPRNELENIDPDKRSLAEVLNVRVDVCRALEKWEMMAEVTNRLRKIERQLGSHLDI
jgi:hypothetical protein